MPDDDAALASVLRRMLCAEHTACGLYGPIGQVLRQGGRTRPVQAAVAVTPTLWVDANMPISLTCDEYEAVLRVLRA